MVKNYVGLSVIDVRLSLLSLSQKGEDVKCKEFLQEIEKIKTEKTGG